MIEFEIRYPILTASGDVDCEINHPDLGWIPFTACVNDPMPYGAAIHAAALLLDPAPYLAPDPAIALAATRAAATLTRAQFCTAVYNAGILTASEAISAARGDWPAVLLGVLDNLPEAEKDAALITWAAATTVGRTEPLILLVQGYLTLTDEQVDAIFGIAA